MASQENSAPRKLQFGIQVRYASRPGELEPFPSPFSGYSDRVKRELGREDRRAYQAQALQSNGLQSGLELPAVSESGCSHESFRDYAPLEILAGGNVRIMDPSTIPLAKRDGKNIRSKYWLIRSGLEHERPKAFVGWYNTELNSPILPEEGATYGFSRVARALCTIYMANKIHQSRSCVMHFHVSPVEGLEVRQAQRAATLVFLLEVPLLFRLSIRTRGNLPLELERGATFVLQNREMWPEEEVFADEVETWLSRSFLQTHRDKMRQLWGALDIEGVGKMIEADQKVFSPFDKTALRVDCHLHPDGTRDYSLEFSHAQASFNMPFVNNWTKLLLLIVKLADLPCQKYSKLVEKLWEIVDGVTDKSTIWPQLLKELNAQTPKTWNYSIDEAYWATRVRENMDPMNDYPGVGFGHMAMAE
ncbi:hypothetical protein HRG_008922 [Hirsutella rhossiliensis]|uniref:Uncharacterized protein n=1 Tax=Hirsutella rhossiliensis TaxID=111463 RepID=A0A9P8SGE1_9HYPO|nr:uncharacterized protein HRG_08922 [Hirsutella rhossiliensis]KAH0959901.1 hypothetical protein HRG_08922 [Hirsutella rhossiliensis]